METQPTQLESKFGLLSELSCIILIVMNNRFTARLALSFILTIASVIVAGPISHNHPPVNAISAGMGLNGVAMYDDPSTIFWNASGLNRMEQMGLDFTVAAPTLESPGSWSFLLANASKEQNSRFGFGMVRHHAKSEGHSFKSFATILPFSHGFKAGNIPFGFSLKLISESINEETWKYGMSVDMGAMWILPTGFKFGISTQNVGGSDLQSFKTKSWFGGYWDSELSLLSFSSQVRAERPFDADFINQNFRLGVNYQITELPFVRDRQVETAEIRSGLMKIDSKMWYSFGFDLVQTGSNTHIGYAVVIEAKTWSGRSHYITYGYRYTAEKHRKSHGGTPFS